MTTTPGPAVRCIELPNPPAAGAQEMNALPAEMPRHASNAQALTIEGDRGVAPVCWAYAFPEKALSVHPPRGSGLADEAGASQRVNIDASRLFNRAPTVSAPASHAQALPGLSKTFGFSLHMFSAPKCVARHQVYGFRVRSRKA